MARSAIKKSTKAVKTRPQGKSIGEKYYGPEPILVGTNYAPHELMRAFNWYNYFFDHNKGKVWLLEYLKKSDASPQLIKEIRAAPDWRTRATTCWMARMMMNGTILPADMMERFHDHNRENALHGIKTVAPKEATNVVSIQVRVQRVIDKLIADAEDMLDSNPEFSMYEFLTNRQATAQGASAIRAYYLPMKEEVFINDAQIKEGYGTKLKLYQKIYTNMISDCDRYLNNKKAVKVRKPRAVKMKTSADIVKNVKYQAADAALKLVSVDPQKIIGASQLWVYNTKYRTLGVYTSNAAKGFSVKGTTLTGYDPAVSVAKKLRKPDEQIKAFFQQGKVALRSFLPNIKTAEIKLNGRLGVDTILLKVV